MLTVYGIPNCNSVKKARTWLESNNIAYQFHDFKKQGLTQALLQQWLTVIPLSVLINKKGTTWRALNNDEQHLANSEATAIELMLQKPSVIKRPVVVTAQKKIAVGYDEALLAQLIKPV